MVVPASAELVSLCQAQIALLTQGLGASLAIVYLTQQLSDDAEPELIPLATYPDVAVHWDPSTVLLPESASQPDATPPTSQLMPSRPPIAPDAAPPTPPQLPPVATSQSHALARGQRQLVLPLVQETHLLGVLVTGRDDRPWTDWEHTQIEAIADSLTSAMVLDQRYQWLATDYQHQRVLEAQQHDLLDNLLHQFRNSLTSLRTFGKLILKRLQSSDTNREVAASIVRETERLQALSEQLANASTPAHAEPPALLSLPPALHPEAVVAPAPPVLGAEASPLTAATLPLTTVALPPVLEPLLSAARAIAQDHQLHLYSLMPPDLPPLCANAQALHEVLNNLLENALKYTPAGGAVGVWVRLLPDRATAHHVEIAVSDTGPGIPLADQPHIFERHYRGVQQDSEIPGTGLGLAIAHNLVTQMQGDLELFSPLRPSDRASFPTTPQPGSGTTFALHLPIWSPSGSSGPD